MRRYADDHGEPPTQPTWESWAHAREAPSVTTLRRLFGSWTRALEAAGFERTAILDWSREEIVELIRKWAAEHDGEVPRTRDWRFNGAGCVKGTFPTTTTVANRFGSWAAAIEAAGFVPRPPGPPAGSTLSSRHGRTYTRARQMVTGRGLDDRLPGTVKHFGGEIRS